MLSRRVFNSLAAGFALFGGARANAAQALWQPAEPSPTAFLGRALDLASIGSSKGEGTPYGAVIVRDNRIVGEGWNRSTLKTDPTAHGEVEAIQDACRRLGTRDLSGCVIYTSGGRPCPMCETACYWAQLDEIVYGTSAANPVRHGAPRHPKC